MRTTEQKRGGGKSDYDIHLDSAADPRQVGGAEEGDAYGIVGEESERDQKREGGPPFKPGHQGYQTLPRTLGKDAARTQHQKQDGHAVGKCMQM